MNILNIEHIHKIYGDKVIFDDVSCGIQEGDKIGIIGINGTGKSTLLKMLADVEEPDLGQIVRQNALPTCLRIRNSRKGLQWLPLFWMEIRKRTGRFRAI